MSLRLRVCYFASKVAMPAVTKGECNVSSWLPIETKRCRTYRFPTFKTSAAAGGSAAFLECLHSLPHNLPSFFRSAHDITTVLFNNILPVDLFVLTPSVLKLSGLTGPSRLGTIRFLARIRIAAVSTSQVNGGTKFVIIFVNARRRKRWRE